MGIQAFFEAVSLFVVLKKVLCASSYPTFFKTMRTLFWCSAKPCVRSTCVPPPRSNVPSYLQILVERIRAIFLSRYSLFHYI